MRVGRLAIAAWVLAGGLVCAQDPNVSPPPGPPRVFVFVQRAPSHVIRSDTEVFHAVVDDLFAFLESRGVAIAEDTFGHRRSAENQVPFSTVAAIAADSGAIHILYVVVDRPVSSWIRVRLECRRADGPVLWDATAEPSWLIPTPGWAEGFTLSKMHEALQPHLGQAGLPLRNSGPEAAHAQPAAPPVIVPEGTEVRLRLAQEVDARASRVGDPVELALAEDLVVGSRILVRQGARALGVIADLHALEPRSPSGDVRIRVTALRAGEQAVPLRGEFAAHFPVALPITACVASGTSGSPSVPQLRIPSGTTLKFVVTERLASDKVHAGDTVHLRAVGDLLIDNLVVVADRAPAVGTVVQAKPARRAWRRGELVWRLDSVTLANGDQLPLAFITSLVGPPTQALEFWSEVVARTFGLALFALPLSPLQHGNEAEVLQGTFVEAATATTKILDATSMAAHQPVAATRSGPALVTVYTPSTSVGVDIRCGTTKLFTLKSGHKTTLPLPPGDYTFRVGRSSVVTLSAGDGGEYFLKASWEPEKPGSRKYGLRFQEMSKAVGAAESEWLKSVPPEHSERCTPLR
ncbi:MAG: hypothetical protein ACM3NQ_15325 [Bacteroidales bacterium]